MDGEFAALELLHALRPSMAVITRMRKDAGLSSHYEDRPGRPARKGARQPLLSARIANPATRWVRVVQSSRTSWRSAGWIEYTSGTALWHHGGKPIVPILCDRGRDAHHCAPPAQIRTGGIPAYGSHLGCLTANR